MEPPSKKYFSSSKLEELILNYPVRPKEMSPAEREQEMAQRHLFIDLLRGLLALNPVERLSPHQALQHPFLRPALPPRRSTPKTMATSSSQQPVPAGRTVRANTLNSLSLREVPPPLAKVGQANAGQQPIPPGEREWQAQMPSGSLVGSTSREAILMQPRSAKKTFKSGNGSGSRKPPPVPTSAPHLILNQRRASQPAIRDSRIIEEEEQRQEEEVEVASARDNPPPPSVLWNGVPASMPAKPSGNGSRRPSIPQASGSRRASAPSIALPNVAPNSSNLPLTPSLLKQSMLPVDSDHLMDIDQPPPAATASASSSRHGSLASSTTSGSMFYGELDSPEEQDLPPPPPPPPNEKRSRAKRHS